MEPIKGLRNGLILGLLLWALILLGALPLFAAPSITSAIVNGGLEDGNSVTLNGADLGSKSPAKPHAYANFDSGTNDPTSDGTVTAWDDERNLTVTGSCTGLDTAGCVVGEWDSSPLTQHFDFAINKATWSTVYLWGKRKFSFTPTSNQKLHRHYPETDGSGTNNFVMSTDSGGIVFNECNDSQNGRFDGFTLPGNAWNTEQMIWTLGTAGSLGGPGVDGNGTWSYRVNQAEVQASTRIANCTDNMKHLKVFHNFTDQSHMPADGSTVHEDDLYTDITTARVMICNATTYAASTVCEIQIPTAWSTTEVSFKLRGLEHISGTKYVYVFDGTIPAGSRDSTPNANGFALTAGGAGVTIARPTVPFTVTPR